MRWIGHKVLRVEVLNSFVDVHMMLACVMKLSMSAQLAFQISKSIVIRVFCFCSDNYFYILILCLDAVNVYYSTAHGIIAAQPAHAC
jgi:hypothetical protein